MVAACNVVHIQFPGNSGIKVGTVCNFSNGKVLHLFDIQIVECLLKQLDVCIGIECSCGFYCFGFTVVTCDETKRMSHITGYLQCFVDGNKY